MKKFLSMVFLIAAVFAELTRQEHQMPGIYEPHPNQESYFHFYLDYGYHNESLYAYASSSNAFLHIAGNPNEKPALYCALAFDGLMEGVIRATLDDRVSSNAWREVAEGRPKADSGTSPEAYSALLSGNADIIFCFEPSDAQLRQARELGVSYKLTPLGKDAFVFFVNKQNPVRNLSSKQIQDIYSGKTTNWRLVGGRDAAIHAFQRPKNSGSQTILEKVMNGIPLITPPTEYYHVSMRDIIEAAANYRNAENALGYSFLYYASEMVRNEQIKLLSFDGIAPTRENIQNETYPFTETFYAITIEGRETENTKKLLQWLSSAEGQKLVELSGYTSYKPAE
ncbi:MAG: substrate-binding domain-containing protein [Candidatus Margulisbacteria bacterium]|jgi:ABC-type phosphate transport system substrate-binding protein|nr:substrate-binding domain-containing protein [Candidatus Margulisiibacteriota bacterium]